MARWFSMPFARGIVVAATGLALAAAEAGCAPAGPSRSPASVSASVAPTIAVTTAAPTEARTQPPVHYSIDQLALAPNGDLYGSACDSARVVRVHDGAIVEVVGSGPGGFSAGFEGDGGPATAAQIECPGGIAFTPDGVMFLADHGNNRIRSIDRAGAISTVAGSGASGVNHGSFSGDGGPATAATLQEPTFLLLDADGNLYISDRDNNRIRRLSTDGTISTIAGNGTDGFAGDGGPAVGAELDDPAGLAIDAAGNLYVSDSNNNRIRRIGTDGVITTIAGTGVSGSTGDGGPATAATLGDPEGLTIGPDGSLFVGEATGNRVRRIAPDGTISTYAGTGELGYTGDGGPATAAKLWASGGAFGLAFDASGNLYIADVGNRAIRVVSPDGVIRTFVAT